MPPLLRWWRLRLPLPSGPHRDWPRARRSRQVTPRHFARLSPNPSSARAAYRPGPEPPNRDRLWDYSVGGLRPWQPRFQSVSAFRAARRPRPAWRQSPANPIEDKARRPRPVATEVRQRWCNVGRAPQERDLQLPMRLWRHRHRQRRAGASRFQREQLPLRSCRSNLPLYRDQVRRADRDKRQCRYLRILRLDDGQAEGAQRRWPLPSLARKSPRGSLDRSKEAGLDISRSFVERQRRPYVGNSRPRAVQPILACCHWPWIFRQTPWVCRRLRDLRGIDRTAIWSGPRIPASHSPAQRRKQRQLHIRRPHQ